MGWWDKKGEEESEETKSEAQKQKDLEIKADKEAREKLQKIDGLETALKELEKKSTSSFSRLDAFLDEQEEAKKAAREAKAKELAAKARETSEEKWIEDPQAALEDALAPTKMAVVNIASMNVRREVFDDGQEFEFYTGDFKKAVDKYIDTLPPNAKTDPQAIKNCYYLVLGQKQKEIAEGKLKSRFSSTTANGKSEAGPEGEKKEIKLSDEQKRAADRLGVPHEKYAKNLEDLAYV